MESNHNGAVEGVGQDLFDFPDFSPNVGYSSEWQHNITSAQNDQQHQQFYPTPFASSSFPSYSHSYPDDGSFQTQYQPPINPSYYQPNPNPNTNPDAPYEGPYQSHPYPAAQPPPQSFPQHSFPNFHPNSVTNRLQQYRNDYGHNYQATPAFREKPAAYAERDSPMQRMQQLARQQYGGTLAAQSAAAAAAEAAQAARRISPPRGKRQGGEETVRDVLQRQYLEQKKREESQLQQLKQQQQALPTQAFSETYPPSLIPQSQPTQPSIPTPACSAAQPDAAPSTHATPIFAYSPVVTPTTPTAQADSSASLPPPTTDASSLATGSALRQQPNPDLGQQAMVARLKKQALMASLQRANTLAAEANPSVEMLSTGALHQAATVVQSLEAKERAERLVPSRKRPHEEPAADRSDSALKPGMRREINEKGEAVERLYVLVHHCNHNDPDYNPEGVLMPFDEYKKEEKRDDMITFSYSSVVTPYEYVDFRVKKPEDVSAEHIDCPAASSKTQP